MKVTRYRTYYIMLLSIQLYPAVETILSFCFNNLITGTETVERLCWRCKNSFQTNRLLACVTAMTAPFIVSSSNIDVPSVLRWVVVSSKTAISYKTLSRLCTICSRNCI